MRLTGRWRVELVAARVTLKQHRFEVGAAVLAAMVLGTWAFTIVYRLGMLGVPAGCIDGWLTTGAAGRSHCVGPMAEWGGLLALEGGVVMSMMKVLPFAAGLLGGVPLIAREVESRTAQTAWSLNSSRRRWLLRVATPVVVLLGVAIALPAVGASAVEEQRLAWGQSIIRDVGTYGLLLMVRAFGAFGLGLLAGALLGRSLPAFVLGAVMTGIVLFSIGVANERWLALQPPSVIDDSATTGTVTGWAWLTPEGATISDAEAMALVPTEVSELDDQEVQAVNSMEWLGAHGYELVALGVTEAAAAGWAPYDALGFGLVGTVTIAGAIVVMDRRRPT